MLLPDPALADALENDLSVIFALDPKLRLTYCNPAWDHFAAANGGRGLLRPAPIGRSLLEFITGTVAEFYVSAFQDVLAHGQAWEHEYECSSSSVFRKFTMRALPIRTGPGILVINSLCVERPHHGLAAHPPDPLYESPGGVILMCSHCRRTRRSAPREQWDWVPAYIDNPPVNASHGLCRLCLEYYYPEAV